jgi:pyruvate/2-oxoglutarate dehydrogenase complex dihydrolipoamide acyltransferase (E2) component
VARTRGTAKRRKPASPAVRKLAREMNVDLEEVSGSGPGGRISRADVKRAVETSRDGREEAPRFGEGPAEAPRRGEALGEGRAPEPPGRDDTDQWGPVRRQPISQTRKTIASVMTHSASRIPHVTDSDDADVTDLDRLRRGYNGSAAPDQKLGVFPFVIRAIARALTMHPIFNASFDESTGEIVYKRYYHVAVGVQTERGLVAPVLHDVDRLSVRQINKELNRLIEKARAGKLTLEDTRGGTYTISNAGAMGGSRYSTPIITHPQVAVLAVGKSRMQPWVVDGEIVPRLIMPLSHSMDHRIIDGALEIAFMQQVIGDLDNPGRLML